MNTSLENDRAPWSEQDEPTDFLASRRIKQQLLAELSESAGPTPADLDDLLGRWPTKPTEDPDVAGLLFQDFRQRSVRGEPVSRSEYGQKYPEYQDSLGSLFRRQDFLRSVTSVTDPMSPILALPKIGDELFGFRLRHQLGQGAFARVFLAEQIELAGRQVALKTSDLCGTEPQTLAQLQHTNIVPIYSVHEDASAGIRAVCMPYFGGAALSQILRAVWEKSEHPQHGSEIVAALASVATSILSPVVAGGSLVEETSDVAVAVSGQPDVNRPMTIVEPPVVTKFVAFDYSHACAWIIARLAEGLQHAHDRGVLHRDIKPSNILIAGDGTPMLLDFNLAHDESQPQAQVEATLGGTVAYMAPEHLRALNIRSREMVQAVDHRADIYGLGMVLFEMIAGHNPFDHQASYSPMPILLEAMASERSRSIPSLRQFNKDASWGLESVVRKCLNPIPSDRYQRAEYLAEDLDRLLDNRPLKHAPELSRVEQVQKWVRRHPRVTTSVLMTTAAAGLLTLGGLLLVGTQVKLAAAQTRVESAELAEAQEHKHEFERGTLKALCLINTHSGLQEHRTEGRDVCIQTLSIYGILDNADWQEQSIWTRLNADEQRQLAEHARELLLALAGARVPLANDATPNEPGTGRVAVESDVRTTNEEGNPASVVDKPGNHRDELGGVSESGVSETNTRLEALALLERANDIHELPASSAVWRAKAVILRQFGEMNAALAADQRADSIPPHSAGDFHLLATAHLQSGASDRHLKAIEELEHAVRIDPRNYWSWMQKGLCHLELHEHAQALADFGVCIGLWPEFAWGHFNRGFALDQIGQKRAAIADYSAALERDSDLIPAYHNRGLARLELGQNEAALSDFDSVIAKHRGEAVIHSLRGQALERLKRHADADAAFEVAAMQLDSLPESIRNQLACSYGFAVYTRLPAEAKRAFQRVPVGDAKYPEALYGLAMIAVNEDRLERAVELFGKALTIRSKFEEARRFRAVLLARLQQFSEAIAEINTALQSDPKNGATLYAAACVTSLAAEHSTTPTAKQQARQESLRFLRQALDRGYGQQAATDDDLAGLRQHPEFEKLLLQSH